MSTDDVQFSESCTYCGATATETDHCPPRVHRHGIIMAGFADRFPFVVVPSCFECNSILRDRPLWTVSDRKRFVKRFLRKKHRKLLRTPRWSRDALEGLEGNLRGYVEASLITKDILNERLDH